MSSMIEGTLKHALFLAKHLSGCEPQSLVLTVLLELGLPTANVGFDYLKHALIVFVDDPSQRAMKGIYLAVGSRCGLVSDCKDIDRAITRVIECGWDVRDEKIWSVYFLPGRDGHIKKPTNKEFITRIGYFLELCMGCYGEVGYAK